MQDPYQVLSCVYIDEHINWALQILHVNNKVSRNMEIIN